MPPTRSPRRAARQPILKRDHGKEKEKRKKGGKNKEFILKIKYSAKATQQTSSRTKSASQETLGK